MQYIKHGESDLTFSASVWDLTMQITVSIHGRLTRNIPVGSFVAGWNWVLIRGILCSA